MTRARVWWIGGAAALGAALAISRAVAPRPAAAAASDTAITSRSISFFESRLAQDSDNFMVGGQLVARYLMRFQVAADLEDVRRAEVVARSVLPLVSDSAGAFARLGVVYLIYLYMKDPNRVRATERVFLDEQEPPAAEPLAPTPPPAPAPA